MRNSKVSTTRLTAHFLIALFILLSSAYLPAWAAATAPSADPVTAPVSGGAQEKAKKKNPPTVAEGGAVSTSRLALPFKRLWQYTDDVTTLAPSADGTNVYLPLAGGRVVCLDRVSGSKNWESAPGGVISAPVAVPEEADARAVFVATRKLATDGSEAGASIRALDKTTGLTLWAKDYPRAFASPLTLQGSRIYAGSTDGSLYALSSETGEVAWKASTQDVVRGRVLVGDGVIYFGSDDGALRGVELEAGREVFKFQTRGRVVGAPASDGRALYFGSGDGYVYAVERQTGKLRWRSRTGAAVEAAPALVDGRGEEAGRILVASFDNFVYALSRASGDRIWKRRMESRISAAPLVVGDAALVAPLRGDHVAVFLTADGRRVNYYRLERELEIVADPVFVAELLLLATDKGLVAVTPGSSADPRANAKKKN